jgi:hypothetical protein
VGNQNHRHRQLLLGVGWGPSPLKSSLSPPSTQSPFSRLVSPPS